MVTKLKLIVKGFHIVKFIDAKKLLCDNDAERIKEEAIEQRTYRKEEMTGR